MSSTFDRRADNQAASRDVYLQYGCGGCAPDEWLNFDASPRLWLERSLVGAAVRRSAGTRFAANVRYGDVVAGLPVPDGATAGVYCSHVLEHLPRDSLPAALRETRRALAPGGRFRLVVPDLYWRAARYVEAAGRGDPLAGDGYFDSCMLGERVRPRRLALIRRHFSRNAHLWLYDFAGLRALLEATGFERIRRCEFGDSGDPMFSLVEEHSRFFAGDERELAIEAFRPVAG